MDALPFDQWTKRITADTNSRRGLLRLGLAAGLGLLGFGNAAGEVAACRRNGRPCDNRKTKNGGCCSGTCKKGKCRPTPGAFGCQVNSGDFCAAGAATTCPNNPDGSCTRLDDGQPLCVEFSFCLPCTNDAYCTNASGGVPGKCARTCRVCQADSGGHVCLYPRL